MTIERIRSALKAVELALDEQLVNGQHPTLRETAHLADQYGRRTSRPEDIASLLLVVDYDLLGKLLSEAR